MNDYCNKQNVTWTFRKEAYDFFFEFIRTNVRINAELTDMEQFVFNLINDNLGISKGIKND